MKNTNYCILLACIFALSCGSPAEPATTPADLPEKEDNRLNPALIEQSHLLAGQWINETYLKRIGKSRSVYSSEYPSPILGYNLHLDELLADTAYFNGFTEHEGGPGCYLVFDKQTGKFIADKSRDDYLDESIQLTVEGNITEVFYTKSNKRERYKKMEPDFESELRKLVMAGKYITADSTEVILYEDGGVFNFEGYGYYDLHFDFVEGFFFDTVSFSPKKESKYTETTQYKYAFNNEKLYLWAIKTDWDDLEHDISETPIILTKI